MAYYDVYEVLLHIGFVDYRVCHIIGFVTSKGLSPHDVCCIKGLSRYRVCCLYRISKVVAYWVCCCAHKRGYCVGFHQSLFYFGGKGAQLKTSNNNRIQA